MQPNSEPTPADIASVAAHLGAPEPVAPVQEAPAPQMQPEAPVSQPAPTQQPTDPFATLFASEPVAPVAPVEPPSQPLEPVAPVTPQTPTEPIAPVTSEYETYEEYMDKVMANVPEAPTRPDPSTIDPDDPNAIKGFFDEMFDSARKQFESDSARKDAIKSSEKQLWDSAMDKYGTLRKNKELRDMVHNIRMANFQRGVAMTPTQAADKLISALQGQYQKGIADNQVVTTYENVQPTGGQTGQALPTTNDTKTILERVQTGGETALADILDAEIKAGRL